MCQRYYFDTGVAAYWPGFFGGYNSTGNNISAGGMFPVTMRAAPTGAVVGTFAATNCGQPILGGAINSAGYFAYATISSTGSGQWYSNYSGHFTFTAEL